MGPGRNLALEADFALSDPIVSLGLSIWRGRASPKARFGDLIAGWVAADRGLIVTFWRSNDVKWLVGQPFLSESPRFFPYFRTLTNTCRLQGTVWNVPLAATPKVWIARASLGLLPDRLKLLTGR